ncbi:MAG TPA: 4Fe-4S binding protein [Patescibacteria group bacterium]|nr:4Fe-4S binding protein [Patescibacteria group bacterium]
MKNKTKNIDINAKAGSTKENHTGSWRTFKPVIDKSKCIGCKRCVLACPDNAMDMQKTKNGLKSKVNYDYCKGCGACANKCPVNAITMKRDEK